jgi:anaerobic magnesium-protoporphyrin IX monomethyl ester cyclase
MKILLLFPPHWMPAMPHLALPTLTAYLRGHGIEVIQRDLNLELFDHLLTRRALDEALALLREQYGPHGDRKPRRARVLPPDVVRGAFEEGPRLASQVEAAKAALRSPAFYDGAAGVAAFEVLGRSLDLSSLPYYPRR